MTAVMMFWMLHPPRAEAAGTGTPSTPSDTFDADMAYGDGAVAVWHSNDDDYTGSTETFDRVQGTNSEDTATVHTHADDDPITISLQNLPPHYGLAFSAQANTSGNYNNQITVTVNGQAHDADLGGTGWSSDFSQEGKGISTFISSASSSSSAAPARETCSSVPALSLQQNLLKRREITVFNISALALPRLIK